MSSNGKWFGHQDCDKFGMNNYSIYNSLLENKGKNDNLQKSGISDFHFSFNPGDLPSFLKIPSINSSLIPIKKTDFLLNDEIETSIRLTLPAPQKGLKDNRNFFTTLGDHILLEDEKSTGDFEENVNKSKNPEKQNNFQFTERLSKTVFIGDGENDVIKKLTSSESLHESLVVPRPNRPTAYNFDIEIEDLKPNIENELIIKQEIRNINSGNNERNWEDNPLFSSISKSKNLKTSFIFDTDKFDSKSNLQLFSSCASKTLNKKKVQKEPIQKLSFSKKEIQKTPSLFDSINASNGSMSRRRLLEKERRNSLECKIPGDVLKTFLIGFFKNKMLAEEQCNFSEKERKVLNSLIIRKYEKKMPASLCKKFEWLRNL